MTLKRERWGRFEYRKEKGKRNNYNHKKEIIEV